MARKAVASYDVHGTAAESVRALLRGLDEVIYELIIGFAQDADDVLARCEESVEEARQERLSNAEND